MSTVKEGDEGVLEWFLYNGQIISDIPQDTTHIKVDPSIVELQEGAFAGLKELNVIDLPEGLHVIGARAFYACLSLSSVTLPPHLEVLGERVFSNCSSLTCISIPGSVKVVPSNAFYDCSRLKTLILHDGVEAIGEAAFSGGSSLVELSIFPSTVTRIGESAFAGCTQLRSVELQPGRLQCIGREAFRGCKQLSFLSIPSTVTEIHDGAFCECSALTEVRLPEGLQTISARLFSRCENLNHVLIPSTTTTIDLHAFRNCIRLASINLPNGLCSIGKGAFKECRSFDSLSIPSTVSEIQSEAFDGCNYLVWVDLPEGLTAISDGLFSDCCSLLSLRIPGSVKHLHSYAFLRCCELVSLELPTGLQSIGNYCFSGCCRLTTIALPESVRSVGDNAFAGASALKEAYFDDDEDDFESDDSFSVNGTLANAVSQRFSESPVHSLCYYHSYHTIDSLLDELRMLNITSEDAEDDFCSTPFHVLAQSARPNLNLMKALSKRFPMRALTMRDDWGMTPLHYLCIETIPGARVCVEYLIQVTILDRVQWLGLQRWRVAVRDEAANLDIQDLVGINRNVDQVYATLEEYEKLEATSLLEMHLWSISLDNTDSTSGNDTKRMKHDGKSAESGNSNIERACRRVICGAGVVIPNVLPYL
eukprot:scaffold874_cov126-Cylindrotheca_fusiformis.AAC.2